MGQNWDNWNPIFWKKVRIGISYAPNNRNKSLGQWDRAPKINIGKRYRTFWAAQRRVSRSYCTNQTCLIYQGISMPVWSSLDWIRVLAYPYSCFGGYDTHVMWKRIFLSEIYWYPYPLVQNKHETNNHHWFTPLLYTPSSSWCYIVSKLSYWNGTSLLCYPLFSVTPDIT